MLRRIVLSAVAIVQMAAPALAVAADGQYLSQSNRIAGQSHAEDHTHRGCVAQHPDDCALCQFVAHHAPLRASAPALPCLAQTLGSAEERTFHQIATDPRALERTRGPPVRS